MNKIFLSMLLSVSFTMAELKQVWVTKSFIQQNIKVIDIRTPAEWKETGIVKNAYTLMFFDETGNFNVPVFLKKLEKIVDKDETFALICRVGSRTGMVSEFLSDKLGYKVINLKGGMMKLIHEGYKTVPYR